MAFLPRLLVICLSAFCLKLISGSERLRITPDVQYVDVRDCSENYTVVLNGSMFHRFHSISWKQTDRSRGFGNPAVKFNATLGEIVNVTIPGREFGVYKFELEAWRRRKENGRVVKKAHAQVHVQKYSSEGLKMFATDIVRTLLQLQYEYISLSHQHLKAICYHPNVAAYFRNLATKRGSMMQEVVQHVMEKQATEDAMNECATDYVAMMMEEGFKKEITFSGGSSDVMRETFRSAFVTETNLAQAMALVFHHAENNGDAELAEFVAADLLPQITKDLNEIKNYIETALAGTDDVHERHVREFLLDKHLKR